MINTQQTERCSAEQLETVYSIGEQLQRHPLRNAVQFKSIEALEEQGQRELVASSHLPAAGDWEGLTKLGVKRGEHVVGDDMFVHAELPPGWKKRATSHAMWSELLDENDEKKAMIFYKAAPYDRYARIHLEVKP